MNEHQDLFCDDFTEWHEFHFCRSQSDPKDAEIQRLRFAMWKIARCRNRFEGPTLEYMQGYRDGQNFLINYAKEVLRGWNPSHRP